MEIYLVGILDKFWFMGLSLFVKLDFNLFFFFLVVWSFGIKKFFGLNKMFLIRNSNK